MQCEKFEARLQDLLDQRARPEIDAQLLEHAENCDDCRDTLALQERLFTGLEIWEAPALSDSFAERIVARHMAEAASSKVAPHTGSRGKVIWSLCAGAMAASLLVGVVTVASRWNDSPVTAPTNVVQKPVVESPVPQAEVVASPIPNAIPEGFRTSDELRDQLAIHFGGAAPEFLDGHTTGRMIREVTTSLPEVATVEQNIPGIRPITSSFSLTIGMVRRTLPGGQDTTTRETPKSPSPVKPQAENGRSAQAIVA